ncbi:MAG: dihydroorotase family protein [archaeon]|nr:dihydroorotase family protein [archaeon]
MKTLLQNGTIIKIDSSFKGSIIIKDSIIEKIIPYEDSNDLKETEGRKETRDIIEAKGFDQIIDCEGKYILAGIIDPHVHLRDMGQLYKESIKTGTFAAINGGITTLLTMPNTIPKLSSKEVILKYMKIIEENSYCNVGVIGGIDKNFSIDTLGKIKELGVFGLKIYPGDTSNKLNLNWNPILDLEKQLKPEFSDGPIDIDRLIRKIDNIMKDKWIEFKKDVENWITLFEKVKELEIPLLLHPDIPILKEERNKIYLKQKEKGFSDLESHSKTYSKFHEILQNIFIFLILCVQREKNNNLQDKKYPVIQFCHVSCFESLEIIELYKKKLEDSNNILDIRIEVTPHHLFLDQNISLNTPSFGKVLVPLRGKTDIKKMQDSIGRGKITFIGTDHAPHTIEEKNKPFFDAPAGFPALDIYVIYFLSKIFNGFLSLEQFTKYASYNPAQYFGLVNKGKIEPENDADIIIVEKTLPYKLNTEDFKTKSKISPYNLDELGAKITHVFLSGLLIINKEDKKKHEIRQNTGRLLRQK